jgi:hypothetical protein
MYAVMHAYRMLHIIHIRFFRSTMRNYKRKTENGSTPFEVMKCAISHIYCERLSMAVTLRAHGNVVD